MATLRQDKGMVFIAAVAVAVNPVVAAEGAAGAAAETAIFAKEGSKPKARATEADFS